MKFYMAGQNKLLGYEREMFYVVVGYICSTIQVKFEDIKVAIRNCKSVKIRQYNRKKDKTTNNNLNNTAQKTKNRVTRTQQSNLNIVETYLCAHVK